MSFHWSPGYPPAGSAMASFCVEDVGIERLRNLTLEAVASRFRAFYELTHFDHLEL